MIETERLILRNWQAGDAEVLFLLARDPLVGPACGWQPHQSAEESRELIEDGPLSSAESYAICQKATGEVIGSISLKTPCEHFGIADKRELEVGYWLGSAFWGRGYASEALGAMVSHAFDDLGCPALWCGFFDGNDRSRRCMEKRGFTYVKSFPGFERPLLGDAALAHFYRLDAAAYALLDQ